jgi:large subunit ribosomal protein L18
MSVKTREEGRAVRHRRIRQVVRGSGARPRLVVFRSLKHIYAQIVDDERGVTLLTVGSLAKELGGEKGKKSGGNIAAAKAVGELVARQAKDKGIDRVVFDRAGYKYHGRVKALADAARAAGLAF